MPSARRLSSSSKAAFAAFCDKNQPLSRRLSSNFDAASIRSKSRRDAIAQDRGCRPLKRHKRNHNPSKPRPSTSKETEANYSSPEPKKRPTNTDKENDGDASDNRMMSPIPYWKVAKERGNKHSPRETRSARKKKAERKANKNDGLLLFSPPNQIANARKEKMELEKKSRERDNRIEENRRNGQLLVFSKKFESLTEVPTDDNDGDDEYAENSTKTVRQQFEENSSLSLNDDESEMKSSNETEETLVSSFSIDDERQTRESEEFSCLTKSTNNAEPSVDMMNAIRGLGEKFEILDRRLSVFPPPQPKSGQQVPDPNTIEELKGKTIQISKLSKKNSKLEKDNENLALEVSRAKSDLSSERQKLASAGAEIDQIESLNESLNKALNEYKEKNDELNNEVLPRTERELQKSLKELEKYKKRVDQTSTTLKEYETTMGNLRSENDRLLRETNEEKTHFQTLNEDSYRAHQKQLLENEKKDQIIKKIQQSLTITKTALENECSRASEKMDELQNALVQLKRTQAEKEKLEEQFLNFKDEIITNNTENNAAIRLVEEQRETLQSRLKELESHLKNVIGEKNDALLRLSTSDKREDELFNQLRESDRVRKELHGRVMVLIGSIRVFVRVRPALPKELEASPGQNIEEVFKFSDGSGATDRDKNSKYGCDDPTKNILEVKEPYKDRGGLSQRRKKWSFGFDNVFDPSHSQEDLWEATEPLVQCAIDGFNVTLFAYGQTGSGKTFTMLGNSESPGNEGIISRSIRKLFEAKTKIEELSRGDKSVSMTVELLEIYNEQVRDLLSSKATATLKISGDKAMGSIHQPVSDEASVFKILSEAEQRRTVKATSSNATSSRSHLLFTIEYSITSKGGSIQVGKLNVCDLAGSERLSKSGAHNNGGALLKETQYINLSLSTLSNVIEKLQAGVKNVPFRDSKLTSLLQNSLGGNSKTLCIVCCNPSQTHFHETLCSLRFASKINKVDLKSVQNFSA
mmetsp:Transcript_27134/g.59712  ORF Transcript_27134/g.59712 Transcript_27134/m.59712 type:complete len:981 (+) Transcript_27134:43-2985(+)